MPQTFNGLTDLDALHLEDNRIRRLRGFEFANLTSLGRLSLQGNGLEHVHPSTFRDDD